MSSVWTLEATAALRSGNFSFDFANYNEDLFVFVSSTFTDNSSGKKSYSKFDRNRVENNRQ